MQKGKDRRELREMGYIRKAHIHFQKQLFPEDNLISGDSLTGFES